MRLMPRLRMPLWAAVAIPTAAYAVRSLLRGSIAPDMPGDAVVLVSLGIVLALAARYRSAAQRGDEDLSDEMQGGHDAEGAER